MPSSTSRFSRPRLATLSGIARLLGATKRQIYYYAYKLPSHQKYRCFTIAKKNGDPREICTPIPPLKLLQQKLLQALKSAYIAKPHVHGYVDGRGPITNAEVHKYRRWVLHVDIQEFFPSITKRRVYGMFRAFPFQYNRDVAEILARLCCAWDHLPQGAPTSPFISNLICRSLDSQLANLARENRCMYTRYCDDLVFSTGRQSFPTALAIVESLGQQPVIGDHLRLTIQSQGFELNPTKTTLRHRTEHQMVTGLTVNQFTNVPRKYIRSLRNLLYIWRQHGKAAAEASFDKLWQRNRPQGKAVPSLEEIVRGRVQYVGSVKGWFDPVYRKLAASLQIVDSSYRPTSKHSIRPKTVIFIHCEGKTDIKHIRAAWRKFRTQYPQLDLRLTHATNDSELLKRMESLSSVVQSTPSVGLFDRDNPKVVKLVKGGPEGYRRWSRGIYTFVLPTPSHRDDTEPLCIELLHTDATLALKDSNGRRVYRSSEFKDNHFHADGHAVAMKEKSSLVVSEVRHVTSQENIALSKDAFAENILGRRIPFDDPDLDGFRPIFDRLVNIRQQWLEDRLEAF